MKSRINKDEILRCNIKQEIYFDSLKNDFGGVSIRKNHVSFEFGKGFIMKDPEKFLKEIDRILDFIEKDYIKKKIKLLHVQEQLKHL